MRTPPKLTRDDLMQAAQRHLALYPCSTVHMRRLLLRKIDKSLAVHGGSRDEAMALLDEVMDTIQQLGWLDDTSYTETKVRGLVKRGVSRRAIISRLCEKGVPAELVKSTLRSYGQDDGESQDAELTAACAYVRKHRMGPYRLEPEIRKVHREKDLARMARAGFSYDHARKVIDATSVEEIETVLRGI